MTGLATRALGNFFRAETTRDGWFWSLRHIGIPIWLVSDEGTDWFAIPFTLKTMDFSGGMSPLSIASPTGAR